MPEQMTLRQAAEMALEALENPWKAKPEGVADAIQALRQALARPEQDPTSENKWKNIVVVFNDKDEPPITGNEYDGKVLNRWSKNFDVYLDGVKGQICTAPPSIETAVLAEREACAKLCDDYPYGMGLTERQLAQAIRARGEK